MSRDSKPHVVEEAVVHQDDEEGETEERTREKVLRGVNVRMLFID
jgi:hypothetical protein